MRVIAGEFRSRRLRSVEGTESRPTSDRLRETLFNIIAGELAGSVFLDAYAGTGAVGIEALSRGADRAIFIEKSRKAMQVIEANLADLGLTARARVIAGSVKAYLAAQKCDIVFLDPPYHMAEEYRDALNLLGKNPPSLVIAQHDRRTLLESQVHLLERVRELRQGDNVLGFYRARST